MYHRVKEGKDVGISGFEGTAPGVHPFQDTAERPLEGMELPGRVERYEDSRGTEHLRTVLEPDEPGQELWEELELTGGEFPLELIYQDESY